MLCHYNRLTVGAPVGIPAGMNNPAAPLLLSHADRDMLNNIDTHRGQYVIVPEHDPVEVIWLDELSVPCDGPTEGRATLRR